MSQRKKKAQMNRGQEYIPYFQSNSPNNAMGERVQGGQFAKESTGWDVYNNEAKKVDTELVNDWRESLNSLLLFAAIFAAVLTAFITESKKMLEQDPTEVLVDVMVFVTNNLANGTHTPYSRPEFLPKSTAVIINSLLFASLSASLVTALASVVALQWVADYDAAITRGGSSPEDRAKRRQFRYAGVVSWNMSEIIAALPLFLYCSVIIFFVGLMIWMWTLNYIVGLVVIIGASLAILFYGISTFLSVVFVSAPFRTPLSRWIYSSTRLLLLLARRLFLLLHIPFSQAWFGSQPLMATVPRRREDIEVEHRSELKVDALVWLANQLSLSQDSYERFLLLASELPKLESRHFLSSTFQEAPWFLIFDLLGWKSFRTNFEQEIDAQDLQAMDILTQCHRIPEILKLTLPSDSMGYLSDSSKEKYWLQFCRTPPDQWYADSRRRIPNFLFLLLRDIPLPSQNTRAQLELTIRLSRWRNSGAALPIEGSVAPSSTRNVDETALKTSRVLVNPFLKITDWSSQTNDDRFKATLVRMMQVMTIPGEKLSPEFLDLLLWRFEALALGTHPDTDSNSCLSAPHDLCSRLIDQNNMDDKRHYLSLHRGFTLLLARNLGSFSGEELVQRIKQIITMLWILNSLESRRIRDDIIKRPRGMDNFFEENQKILKRWMIGPYLGPQIYEILHYLGLAQAQAPKPLSLWRSTTSGGTNNLVFLEVLMQIDRIILSCGIKDSDHFTMINLLCQDIELGPPEEFIDLFTSYRGRVLHNIQDPCLQLLAKAAGGSAAESLRLPFIDVSSPRQESYTRVATHVFKIQENPEALCILPLCASLWHFAPKQTDQLNKQALSEMNVLMRLENIFQCDILCPSHFNGEGHLLLHVFSALGRYKPVKNMEEFTDIPKDKFVLDALLMILLLPEEHDEVSPQALGQEVDPQCLSRIVDMCKRIKKNQFTLLTLLADLIPSITISPGLAAEDVEVMSFCINAALCLPRDPRSIVIIPIITTRLLEFRDEMMELKIRTKKQNLVASKKAEMTADSLKTLLASMLVFGGQSRRLLSCARMHKEGNPALGWLSVNLD